jgi:hypothetical protein
MGVVKVLDMAITTNVRRVAIIVVAMGTGLSIGLNIGRSIGNPITTSNRSTSRHRSTMKNHDNRPASVCFFRSIFVGKVCF